MNKYLMISASAVIVAASLAGYFFLRPSPPPEPLVIALHPDDAAKVARGEEVYVDACASCHGANLEGQANWRRRNAAGRLPAPPHDETGHTWHHPDTALFELTKFGPAALVGDGYESDMPGYADTLSDEEILEVLSYIKSQWRDEIRSRHDRINAGGGMH